MGGVPSTPRWGGDTTEETAEYLIGTFVGDKSFPISSEYWNKLLELPYDVHWPANRVQQACETFARNNCSTRHLAKILIHLTWCLQESLSTPDVLSMAAMKAVNASYISSVFLKYSIENLKSENLEDLYLSLDGFETMPNNIPKGESIINMVMHAVLSYIGKVDIRPPLIFGSPKTYLLHHELLNFMLIAMSTQLLSGPSPGPNDIHPFIDAAMSEESSLVGLVVQKLLLNYISRPRYKSNASYTILSEENQLGVLKRVGSAAGA